MKMSTLSSRSLRGSSSVRSDVASHDDVTKVLLTVVILLQVFVEYRIILDDVLRGGRTDGGSMGVEKLRLEVAAPELCLGQLHTGLGLGLGSLTARQGF